MSFRTFLVVLLFVVLLAGATGGSESARNVGEALNQAVHWIADAWDQNACLFELSPVTAYLEEVVLEWLIDLFGLPRQSAGALVVGTQTAHVTALAAARHALLATVGWDVEQDGLFGKLTASAGQSVASVSPGSGAAPSMANTAQSMEHPGPASAPSMRNARSVAAGMQL